jgi:hypothetical protein
MAQGLFEDAQAGIVGKPSLLNRVENPQAIEGEDLLVGERLQPAAKAINQPASSG